MCGLRGDALSALDRFGNHLGISFQMLDDLLDVISPEERLGKRPGTDLRERKPSLINLLWLNSGSPLAQRLREEPKEDEEAFIAAALAEIAESSIIGAAREIARGEALAARAALGDAVTLARDGGVEVSQEALAALDLVISYTLGRME